MFKFVKHVAFSIRPTGNQLFKLNKVIKIWKMGFINVNEKKDNVQGSMSIKKKSIFHSAIVNFVSF